MTIATLTETVHPFAVRLATFRERLEAAAPSGAHELAIELEDLAERSSRTADANVNAAVASGDDAAFERAQTELRELRRDLATLALTVQERFFEHVPADTRRRLSVIALLELEAPMMDRPGLERFRRSVAWIREQRGAARS